MVLKKTNIKVAFSWATLEDYDNKDLVVTPEMLFSRHLAILGSTGSGKSHTLAKLIEEAANFNSKIVLFDSSGEYKTLQNRTCHIHLGGVEASREYSIEAAIPYSELFESDLFSIFNPSGESQAPKLRDAIKTLKLLKLVPSLGVDGTMIKANKTKVKFQTAYNKHYETVEGKNATFDIQLLARQVNNECIDDTRSSTEPLIWGDMNQKDKSNCAPLVNRIRDVVGSKNLACIFDPGRRTSLFDIIDNFLIEDTYRVICISLEHLPFINHVREIVANSIGRHLLGIARKSKFTKKPVVVMLDEAHHFLNEKLISDNSEYPLNSFELMAKEGRKYSLNIVLATQRPRDVPEGILSQMGTMIIHRLINAYDRKVVESACGEIDEMSVARIPILAPGQAVLTGISFATPLLIRVKIPNCTPKSQGPNYQQYW